MTKTLDQQRAALAWGYATDGVKAHEKKYKNLAKGAPALIMNSGLMPTLAFYKGKAGNEHQALLNHLLAGLIERKVVAPKGQPPKDTFTAVMVDLQQMQSRDYLRCTDEALELLKWVRQFVEAVPAAVAASTSPPAQPANSRARQ